MTVLLLFPGLLGPPSSSSALDVDDGLLYGLPSPLSFNSTSAGGGESSERERAAFLAILESRFPQPTHCRLPLPAPSLPLSLSLYISLSLLSSQCRQFVAMEPMPWRRILERGKAKARILPLFSRFFGRDYR